MCPVLKNYKNYSFIINAITDKFNLWDLKFFSVEKRFLLISDSRPSITVINLFFLRKYLRNILEDFEKYFLKNFRIIFWVKCEEFLWKFLGNRYFEKSQKLFRKI